MPALLKKITPKCVYDQSAFSLQRCSFVKVTVPVGIIFSMSVPNQGIYQRHNNYTKYFVPFSKPRHSGILVFLEVPHFATFVYKSTKHFGLSFAYDAPKIWNDLPDDESSATSLHSFRKKLICTNISPLISPFPNFSPWH